jgi:hypothetical protein
VARSCPSGSHQHADPSHPLGLLRSRRQRPRRRAADERDELASSHWRPRQRFRLYGRRWIGRAQGPSLGSSASRQQCIASMKGFYWRVRRTCRRLEHCSRRAPRRHCALDADNCTLSPEKAPVRLVKYTGLIVPNMEMCHENARCCSGPRYARCVPVLRPVGPRRPGKSGKSIPLADVYRSGCRSERAGQVSLAIEALFLSGGVAGLLSGLRLYRDPKRRRAGQMASRRHCSSAVARGVSLACSLSRTCRRLEHCSRRAREALQHDHSLRRLPCARTVADMPMTC